jgi:hypothetical protein
MKRLDNPRRITYHHRPRRDIFRYHTPGANHGAFTNRNPAKQGDPRTNRGVSFYQSGNTFPISFRLQLAIDIRGPGMEIVGKGDIMTDENFVFERHPLADKGMARNFAAVSDFGALLDFDESADLYVVANFTPIQIDKPMEPNVPTQLDIRSNPLQRLLRQTHIVGLANVRRPRV